LIEYANLDARIVDLWVPLAFYLFARTINVRIETRIEIEAPASIQSGSRVMT
jgi:hypothetical protein